MLELVLEDASEKMDKAVAHARHEFSTIRTGRASAALIEKLPVEYYGTDVPLQQLAGFSVPEPRLLVVTPFDKSSLNACEKAIRNSGLGLNPAAEGAVIRVPLPELNEERRRELTKVAHNYAEQARVAVRHIRRDGMDLLKKLEKDGNLAQDESRKFADQVQTATDNAVGEIDKIVAVKEQEIMQV